MTIGERIRIIRGEMSREKFSVLTNISRNTLVNYEKGESSPTYDYLIKIIENIPDVDPTWLLTGDKFECKSGSDLPKSRIAEVAGEQVPQPCREHLDKRLLALTISRLKPVFVEHNITADNDQAGIITDIYSSIIEKNLARNHESVEDETKELLSFFNNKAFLIKLGSIGPNILNYLHELRSKMK